MLLGLTGIGQDRSGESEAGPAGGGARGVLQGWLAAGKVWGTDSCVNVCGSCGRSGRAPRRDGGGAGAPGRGRGRGRWRPACSACVRCRPPARRIDQPRAPLAALYSARPTLGRSWPRLRVASCGWADGFCVLWVLQVVDFLADGVAVSLGVFSLCLYCMSVAALTLEPTTLRFADCS